MPVSYVQDMLATPGVTNAVACTWFGGSYQDKPNQFAVFATDLDQYLKLYPEFKVPPDQLKAALGDRQGVDRRPRHRDDVRLEDRRPHSDHGGHLARRRAADVWEFNIDGIYDGDEDRRQDAVPVPLRLLRREPAQRQGQHQLVSSSGVNDPSQARRRSRKRSTRSSRTRRPRRRPRPRRRSSRTSPSRPATSARCSRRSSSSCSSRFCSSSATRWRSRCASGRASSRCSRRSAFRTALILALVLAESLFLAVLAGGHGARAHRRPRGLRQLQQSRCCRCSCCSRAGRSSRASSCSWCSACSPARCRRWRRCGCKITDALRRN